MSLVTGSLRPEARLSSVVVIITPCDALPVLQAVLERVPSNFPAAIVLLLHPSSGRERPVMNDLGASTRLMVMPGSDGTLLRNNRAYVVYSTQRLVLGKDNLLSSSVVDIANSPIAMTGEFGTAPLRPDALLDSLAERYGAGAIAVALTDVDAREAEGFRRVKAARGHTIALKQGESFTGPLGSRTMPAPADESLPAHEIGERLTAIVARKVAAGKK